jgi:hypothetical protein
MRQLLKTITTTALILTLGVAITPTVYATDNQETTTILEHVPPAISQGATSACTAYAIAYVIGTHHARKNKLITTNETINPDITHTTTIARVGTGNNTRTIGNQTYGTTLKDVWDTLEIEGGFKTNGTLGNKTTTTKKPVLRAGNIRWIKTYQQNINPAEVRRNITATLEKGDPIVLNLEVTNKFITHTGADYTPTDLDDTTRFPSGFHAVAAVGHTPEGVIVQNSWGTQWGYQGRTLLPWVFLDTAIVEASVLETIYS